jgi:serine protease Do
LIFNGAEARLTGILEKLFQLPMKHTVLPVCGVYTLARCQKQTAVKMTTMKKTSLLNTAVLIAGLAAGGLAHGVEPPKLTIEQFRAKLKKDDSPLPAGGQMQMSYAGVVEKILPSVVTITSSGQPKGRGGFPNMDQVPPGMEDFFRRWFGAPEDGENGGESNPFDQQEDRQPPRKRPGQKQEPEERAPKDQPPQRLGVGSGMIISSDGYILTNNHVIEGSDKLEVAVDMPDGSSKTHQAKVIGTDPLTDVALIKIEVNNLPSAILSDSAKLRVGDVVLAAGAPMELAHSVTMGIVSAIGRKDIGIVRGEGRNRGFEDFIQTDASINPGNSGGPLVDAMGRVVGINTAIFSRSGMNAGIGFAIPIKMALTVVEDLLDDGKVSRGYLGVQIKDLDLDTAKDLGLTEEGGAVVIMVGSDSPAEKAGVEVGDVIVSVAGQRVNDSSSLRLIVSGNKPGAQIPLEVMRDNKKVVLNALLEALPEEALAAGGSSVPRGGSATSELIDGVTAQDIDDGLAKRFKLDDEVEGVVVTKVNPESSAAEVGLQEGDVIMAINRQPVSSLDEAKAAVKGKKSTIVLKVRRKGDTMLVVVRD